MGSSINPFNQQIQKSNRRTLTKKSVSFTTMGGGDGSTCQHNNAAACNDDSDCCWFFNQRNINNGNDGWSCTHKDSAACHGHSAGLRTLSSIHQNKWDQEDRYLEE